MCRGGKSLSEGLEGPATPRITCHMPLKRLWAQWNLSIYAQQCDRCRESWEGSLLDMILVMPTPLSQPFLHSSEGLAFLSQEGTS